MKSDFKTICISESEKNARLGNNIVNVVLWLFIIGISIGTMGIPLIFILVFWLANKLFAEYNVRKLISMGTTASNEQFPAIYEALNEVSDEINLNEIPKLVIIPYSQVNAFALRYAKKKIIILPSETIEGILNNKEELKFILGHEAGHLALDFGKRGIFEIYKSAKFKAARELTCDNFGLAVCNNLSSAKLALKRLIVGNKLYTSINEKYLIEEAKYLNSGFTGWILKNYSSYPPFGTRIENLNQFEESRNYQK